MTEETTDAAYDRGVIAGEIAARLANHDMHFASINGAVTDLVTEMHGMRLDVQRLGDQADAAAKTVLATAAALKAADDARRAQSDRTWSPWTRGFAVITVAAVLVATVVSILALQN